MTAALTSRYLLPFTSTVISWTADCFCLQRLWLNEMLLPYPSRNT